jgi:hypothetical protein
MDWEETDWEETDWEETDWEETVYNRSAQVIHSQRLDRQDGNPEFRPKVTVAFEGSWVK